MTPSAILPEREHGARKLEIAGNRVPPAHAANPGKIDKQRR